MTTAERRVRTHAELEEVRIEDWTLEECEQHPTAAENLYGEDRGLIYVEQRRRTILRGERWITSGHELYADVLTGRTAISAVGEAHQGYEAERVLITFDDGSTLYVVGCEGLGLQFTERPGAAGDPEDAWRDIKAAAADADPASVSPAVRRELARLADDDAGS